MRYKLTPAAQSDIDDLTLYSLKNFGVEQAQKYLEGLEYSFELLCENPYMGRPFDDRRRRYVYRQHLVYYVPTPNYILIVSIVDGRRLAPEAD